MAAMRERRTRNGDHLSQRLSDKLSSIMIESIAIAKAGERKP